MKIYLVLVYNVQQWDVHNAKMVILNLDLNVIINFGAGSELFLAKIYKYNYIKTLRNVK
jgi:hypothetical protein